jgi:hypothetical protein
MGIMFPRSGLRTDVVDTLRRTTSVLHRYIIHKINSNRFPLLHKRIHTMMKSTSEEEMNSRIEDDIYLHLPPNTSKHWYTGLDEFWSCIDLERARFYDSAGSGRSSEYVVFFNVSEQTFAQDFDIARHKSSWQLVNSYNPSTEILLVKVPTTREHERAHGSLINLMITKLAGMNAANLSLDWYGAADKRTPSRTKKPDQQFAPQDLPAGRSDEWPTMVMESGFSQSESQLDGDAMWWVTESRGDVKMAITTSVDRTKPTIVFRQWGPVQTGQTRTRVQVEPVLQQSVVVSKPHGQSTVSVSNRPLTLPFSDLFLAQPVATKGERDIEFTDTDLEAIARQVWDKQKFGH